MASRKEYFKEYRARPEVKERMKEYYARPEVKEHKKEYYARPEVKERMKELCLEKALNEGRKYFCEATARALVFDGVLLEKRLKEVTRNNAPRLNSEGLIVDAGV